MDSRARRVNKLVKEYDRDLHARRDDSGVIHIYRRRPLAHTFFFQGVTYVHVTHAEDHIISLTDTWGPEGKPVEWGLEPIWRKFLQMDSWRDDTGYERFAESRERYNEDRVRMRRNDFRARAADMRRDFAKATNELVIRQESLDRNNNQKFF